MGKKGAVCVLTFGFNIIDIFSVDNSLMKLIVLLITFTDGFSFDDTHENFLAGIVLSNPWVKNKKNKKLINISFI